MRLKNRETWKVTVKNQQSTACLYFIKLANDRGVKRGRCNGRNKSKIHLIFAANEK